MKGFIRLTTDEGVAWIVPIAEIRHMSENTDQDRKECRLPKYAKTFVEIDREMGHVRESIAEVEALIREAQAPTADEIAAVVAAGYIQSQTIMAKDGCSLSTIGMARECYDMADAILAERRRRATGSPATQEAAECPSTCPCRVGPTTC